MKKRLLAAVLCLSMVAASLIGCGAKNEPVEEAVENSEVQEEASLDVNKDGYPIVNEPITLKVAVSAPNSAIQGAWEDLEWVKELQKVSGINFEFIEYADAEAVSLMFATRDFPDVSFNIGTDKQIADAAEAGDVLALDEYMEEYAPNWNKYFEENPEARKLVTDSEGHIYSFPYVREEPQYANLRDEWFINKVWLDELGLPVPTTTEEFYNTLKAFKENAGTGSIPENVIPYYIYHVYRNVGGGLDLINSFGVRNHAVNYCVTVDDNGKVEFNYTNEAMKEPLGYINKLVNEGLISKDCFTDDWSAYVAKTQSAEAMVGSFHAYSCASEDYVAMGPLDSGNGNKPIIRSQTNAVTRNRFTVYANCEHPEVAILLANMIADPDWSMQGLYGMYGDLYQSIDDNGTRTMLAAGGGENYALYSCPHSRVATLSTYELFENFEYEEGSQNYKRGKDFAELYADYAIPQKNLYPNIILSADNADRIAELNTDIVAHLESTFDLFALNGGIEEGWEDHVSQLEALGLEEYLTLLQEELDAFNAR